MKKFQKIKKKRKKRQESWEKWDLSKVDWEQIAKIFEPEKKNILDKLRQKQEQYPEIKELLYLLSAGVLVSASLVMPGLTQIIEPFPDEFSGYQRKRLKQNLKRLKKQKLVEVYQEGEYQVVKISERGKARALKYKLDEMEIKKPKHWDRKWRMVVFDIPERLHSARDFFRQKLKELGFFSLQRSVFIHPYPCFEEIEFLRQIFHLGNENISYAVVEEIEGEEELKDHFDF